MKFKNNFFSYALATVYIECHPSTVAGVHTKKISDKSPYAPAFIRLTQKFTFFTC